MFDRRQLIVNSKKYFLSNEYLRKVFESNKSQRNIKSKDNSSNFRKIETIQKRTTTVVSLQPNFSKW